MRPTRALPWSRSSYVVGSGACGVGLGAPAAGLLTGWLGVALGVAVGRPVGGTTGGVAPPCPGVGGVTGVTSGGPVGVASGPPTGGAGGVARGVPLGVTGTRLSPMTVAQKALTDADSCAAFCSEVKSAEVAVSLPSVKALHCARRAAGGAVGLAAGRERLAVGSATTVTTASGAGAPSAR